MSRTTRGKVPGEGGQQHIGSGLDTLGWQDRAQQLSRNEEGGQGKNQEQISNLWLGCLVDVKFQTLRKDKWGGWG